MATARTSAPACHPSRAVVGLSQDSAEVEVVKGQRAGEEPVNYGHRLANFVAGYVAAGFGRRDPVPDPIIN